MSAESEKIEEEALKLKAEFDALPKQERMMLEEEIDCDGQALSDLFDALGRLRPGAFDPSTIRGKTFALLARSFKAEIDSPGSTEIAGVFVGAEEVKDMRLAFAEVAKILNG